MEEAKWKVYLNLEIMKKHKAERELLVLKIEKTYMIDQQEKE